MFCRGNHFDLVQLWLELRLTLVTLVNLIPIKIVAISDPVKETIVCASTENDRTNDQ